MVAGAADSIESFRMLLSLGSNTNAMETVSISTAACITCYVYCHPYHSIPSAVCYIILS